MMEEKDRKRFQMETGSQLDLISELPEGIIERILMKLPIGDAVRTSILSSRWRYKWASMTDIVLDDSIATGYSKKVAQNRIVKFISQLLFLHDGAIRKFFLSLSCLQATADIAQWLLFLSRKDVKELVINFSFQLLKVPSCLFSCNKLTWLELSRCELNIPPNFKGFPCLKCLILEIVLVSRDKIESLISSSHLLENLKLSELEMHDTESVSLTARAPNLKHLILEGCFRQFSLADTRQLVDLSVVLGMDDEIEEHLKNAKYCLFDRIFCGAPKLERLKGDASFTVYLSRQKVDYLGQEPVLLYHLKSLELHEVDFYHVREGLVVLQMITRCPNLEHLQISSVPGDPQVNKSTNVNFGEWELLKLKTVKFIAVGATYELKLIDHLLRCSPALEVMRVDPSPYASAEAEVKKMSAGLVNMVLASVASPRSASPDVSIVFSDRWILYI